jgi:hypothetical protein
VSVSPPSVLRHRDPAVIRRTLAVWGGLAMRYFRADVRGLDQVPESRFVATRRRFDILRDPRCDATTDRRSHEL